MSANLSTGRNRRRLAHKGLRKRKNGLVRKNGNVAHVNVELTWGPDARQADALVPLEVIPDSGTEKVRAKLTENQRRDLRIAFVGSKTLTGR